MGALRWVDRNMWLVPFLSLVLLAGICTAFNSLSAGFLFTLGSDQKSVYNAIASAAGSLLGFLIAAITIVASFSNQTSGKSVKARQIIRRARVRVMAVLGSTALLTLLLLLTTFMGLIHWDNHDVAHVINYVVFSVGTSVVVGLGLSGLGLALAIVEQTRSATDSSSGVSS